MKRTICLLIAVSMVIMLTACLAGTKVSVNDSIATDSIYDKYSDAYVLSMDGDKASLNGEEIKSYEYIRKYDPSMQEPEYMGDEPDKRECYIAHDINYYPEIDSSTFTKEKYDDETEWVTHYTNAELSDFLFSTLPVLGEDLPVNMMHSAEEAYYNPVLHITQPGEYILEGNWNGQIYVDLGDKDECFADESKKVTLILNGADVTCSVAPALVFYSVYECDNGWENREETLSAVDISDAGARIIIADGTENNFTGANVYRLLKPKYKNDDTKVQKKLAKMDGAFYSFVSMLIDGNTGILNINSTTFEGLDTELHLQINGGYINIVTQDDGINVNEDHVSVFTQNGGHVMIFAGQGAEGDVVDSNGYININGGFIAGTSPSVSDNMLDSEDGTYVSDEATVVENVAGIKGGPGRPGEFGEPGKAGEFGRPEDFDELGKPGTIPAEGFDEKEPPERPEEMPIIEGD